MKYILIFILSIIVTGCINSGSNSEIPDNLKKFANDYLGSYEYSYEDISSRGNHITPQYALFKIYDEKKGIENFYNKLISGGWRKVPDKGGYIRFCKGEYISLSILDTGIEAINNKNLWEIYYFKGVAKVPKCNKNPDYVDFNKIGI